MATNFFAALHPIARPASPPAPPRPGSADAAIVNIASIGGKFAMPHMLPYIASKFALVGFSEGLHAELRHKGIRVTTVCPGLMRTGGEVHAQYTGQTKKEQRWFTLAARTPILSASVKFAADKIYKAVAAGRTEITITPQAWLAARPVGLPAPTRSPQPRQTAPPPNPVQHQLAHLANPHGITTNKSEASHPDCTTGNQSDLTRQLSMNADDDSQ